MLSHRYLCVNVTPTGYLRCAGMQAAMSRTLLPLVVVSEARPTAASWGCATEECCKMECAKAGYCCNTDLHGSSNHFLSCFQACAMRVAGDSAPTVHSRCNVGGQCGGAGKPPCRLGFTREGCEFDHPALGVFMLCGGCSDLGDKPPSTCSFGVPNKDVCNAGADLVWEAASHWGWAFCLSVLLVVGGWVGVGLAIGTGGLQGHPHYRQAHHIVGLVRDGLAFVKGGPAGRQHHAPDAAAGGYRPVPDGTSGGYGKRVKNKKKSSSASREHDNSKRNRKGTRERGREGEEPAVPPPTPTRSDNEQPTLAHAAMTPSLRPATSAYRGDEWAPPKPVLSSGARETGAKVQY